MRLVLFSLIILEQYFRILASQEFIALYEKGEIFNPQCYNGSQQMYHLDDLAHLPLNDTQIRICSETLAVPEIIEIFEGTNIEMTGYGFPVLQCNDSTEAGFIFGYTFNLYLSNFSIKNCAFLITSNADRANNMKTGLGIVNSTNVTLQSVLVTDSPGTGLSMFDNKGLIHIQTCTFERNGYDRQSGGNGLYMEVNAESNTPAGVTYVISDSYFNNNTATTLKDSKIDGFSQFDKGGGMCITCLSCQNIVFKLLGLRFERNVADTYGGGLLITYHGEARNSCVHLNDSTFFRNNGQYGGGLYIGYLHTRLPVLQMPINCSYILQSVNFVSNVADFGGGTSIYSTKTDIMDSNTMVIFQNCSWKYNYGHYGSAVSLLPNAWNLYDHGYLPTPVFNNCTIKSNYVLEKEVLSKPNFYQYSGGAGAFYCSRHNVTFKNVTLFLSNNGSALYLLLCLATFYDSSEVIFSWNFGYSGGAIYLLSSIVYFSNNANVQFIANRASNKGGAIYEESPLPHVREYSKTCFLDYVDNIKNVTERNVTVLFILNEAGLGNSDTAYGHSIYGTSLQPCYTRFSVTNKSINIFSMVGNFIFLPNDMPMNIATDTDHSEIMQINWPSEVGFIAGKAAALKFTDVDDLGQPTKTSYLVSVTDGSNNYVKHNTTIETGLAYSYVSNYTLALSGPSNQTANVTLTSTSSRLFSITFKVSMEPCPPGFVQRDVGNDMQCQCPDGIKYQYPGISVCDLANFRAYRKRGYWLGYDKVASEDALLSGECPSGYCSYENLQLPDRAGIEYLNDHICNAPRTGKLCGICISNHSVYYNSLDFRCKENNGLCNWGWLLYILSELLPVTLVFIVIIFFNISFTSGLVNGFILYAQVVEWLHVSDFLTVPFSEAATTLNNIHIFIYRMFSLHFFVMEKFTFCLWRGANALDILAFRYIQLVYAILLIFFIIFVMNKCNSVTLHKMQKCFAMLHSRSASMQGGIIHGLSAFLILCYTQCLSTSIMLLSSSRIEKKGSMNMATVVYYDGEIEWFSLRHLKYAIPAIIFSLLVVVIPPVLLLVYPLHYRIIAILRLEEQRYIRLLVSPLEKLKPFLDSFQSCFKDEYRFFSGLYLLYRLGIQLNMGLVYIHQSYLVLEFELIVMLLLHSICQPYKERWHNIIDTLLFCNLILINGLTLYNVSLANSGTYDIPDFTFTTWTQVLLIILPALAVIIVTALIVCRKIVLLLRHRHGLKLDEYNNEYTVRFEYDSLENS